MIRVFLVVAPPQARASLEKLLKARGVEVIGTAANMESLIDQLSDSAADVFLVDSSGEPSYR